MFVALFMLLFVQGLVTSEEEIGNNNPMSCFEILENHGRPNFTDVIPNSETILLYCPVSKEFMDCVIRTVSETGEFFDMDDVISVRSFLEDICDEASYLHQGYVNNFDCFILMKDNWYDCKEIASSVIQEFRKSSYAFESTDLEELYITEEDEEDMKEYRTFAEAHCLLNAHAFACIGMEMQERCGHGAYETFSEIMSRGFFGDEYCDSYALKHFMKGYFDYLSIEKKTTEIDIIRDLFNVETD